MAHRRARRASLRFRRALRLHLADHRGLRRQHHDDPRPRRSGASGRGRALVDPRPVEGGRGNVPLGELGAAALPSPLTHGRSALCQLLASRPVHSRHFRHGAPQTCGACRNQPGLPASHAHLPADSASAQGPPRHGGGGRGRGQAAAHGAVVRLDLRHHHRADAGADRDVSGAGTRPRRQPAAGDERLPSAIGTPARHRDPVRLVCPGAASRRHRQPVRAEGSRPLPAGPSTIAD